MWYQNSRIIIAALEDTLANLAARGASEFILNRIRSSPPEYQGHYINQLMRNPLLSENELITQVLTAVDKQKSHVQPPTMMEKNIANLFVPSQQQWALVYLKKLRTNPTASNPTYRSFENGSAEDQDYNLNTVFNQIADWARVSLREDPRFQLAAYDFNQALSLSNEWHNMMAGKGSDKFYRPYQRDADGNIIDERVVYQFDDGWHISQLLDADDLTVEGNRMNHCFAPGAMVRTLDGFKQIENIELGELVVCGDGTFRKVTKLFKQPYTGLMIRMGTRVGVDANLITPNHEFLSLKKLHGGEKPCQPHSCGKSSRYNEHEVHDVEWKSIGELSINSYLVTSYPLEYFDMDEIHIPVKYTGLRRKGSTTFNVDEEFLWMVGMFVAEGSATKNKIQFAISKNETEYADKLESFFKKHNFGYHWRKDSDSYGGRVLIVGSRMLGEWFSDWLGKGCANKKIPSVLLNLPNEKIEALARGVLDGDGCSSRNVLHQTSSMLALQMSEISLRLGGFPSISIKHPKNKKTSYVLEGADALVPRTSVKRGFWEHKNYILAKPNIFDTEQYSGFVYNLEVDTIHSYSVQNILVHNCVGVYCSEVASGESRIFSLRDVRNQPTVTIEMEGDSNTVKQIKAHSDQVPEQELRYRLREWFANLEDGAQFKQSNYEWEGPEWYDRDTSSIRGNIYEEAYGREYDDYGDESSQDYHSDYGIDGETPDWTRNVVDLDVSDLIDNVEEAMLGTRGRPGAFDRASQYDNVDEVFEALADVIVAHDTEQINQILSPENSNLNHMRRLYDSSKDEWNLGKVRNYLGLFDIVEKYNDAYNEALEETELQKNGFGIVDVKDLVAESYKLELYYETLQQAVSQISTEMDEQYKKIAGVGLVQDLQANIGDNMRLVWHEYNEKVQPALLRHRDSFPKGEEPRDEHGNIDESVFDENGWKYSKFKGWYRRA